MQPVDCQAVSCGPEQISRNTWQKVLVCKLDRIRLFFVVCVVPICVMNGTRIKFELFSTTKHQIQSFFLHTLTLNRSCFYLIRYYSSFVSKSLYPRIVKRSGTAGTLAVRVSGSLSVPFSRGTHYVISDCNFYFRIFQQIEVVISITLCIVHVIKDTK